MNHSESTCVQMTNKCVHNFFHPARTCNNLVVISIVFKGNCDTDISNFTILILDCFFFFNFPSKHSYIQYFVNNSRFFNSPYIEYQSKWTFVHLKIKIKNSFGIDVLRHFTVKLEQSLHFNRLAYIHSYMLSLIIHSRE